ncbi:MAG: hypothetical protein IMW89_02310 [Ktedonobacteraceae bacterium]|nr:hypothetical protein [Ktedonobacteraceae bacterium]
MIASIWVLYTFNTGTPFTAAGVLCLLTLGLLFVPGVVRLFPRKQKLEG